MIRLKEERTGGNGYLWNSVDLSRGWSIKHGMKKWFATILAFPVLACPVPEEKVRDWRVDLLKEEGIGLDRESLQKALAAKGEAAPELEEIYRRLGSARFADREKAQKELERLGEPALEWLRQQEVPFDPELKMRVKEVIQRLESNHRKARESAVKHAVRTLLADGEQRGGATGGRFFEWFGTDVAKIDGEYRQFVFKDQVNRGGKVQDGALVLPGGKLVDGDQRLVLKSEDWPGAETFGAEFEVSAKLGADSSQGIGAWHLGISIGNVKVLYHPGLSGGSFRFERLSDNRYLSGMTSMGFDPKPEVMQWMSVKVSHLADERVLLKVVVEEGGDGNGRFEIEKIVSKEDIGDLSEVSLVRSGRTGSSALFQDFEIKLLE
ncbi:MAG: hypothetical protein ACON38_20515 [Akkermansiaceae bacterium]